MNTLQFMLLLLYLSPPAAAQSPLCQDDQAYCETSGQCLDSQYVCDGNLHCRLDCSSGVCIGWNDELPERCNNCSDPGLFLCHNPDYRPGIDRCIMNIWVCDGVYKCGDMSDEWASNCNNCTGQDTPLFRCMQYGVDRCSSSSDVCNGGFDCDLWEDEDPDICNDCEAEDLFLCEDRSRCVHQRNICDTSPDCLDASDEYNCHYDNTTMVSCPGLPDYLIPETSLCDGLMNCPDQSDELGVNCNNSCKEDESFTCADHSFCARTKDLCDGYINCWDGSDERSEHCHCNDQFFIVKFQCEDGGCVRQSMLCTATESLGPFCNDSSDMSPDLCQGKCYLRFPGIEDTLRRPCNNGEKCISVVNWCDGELHCQDGSDEADCNWIVNVTIAFPFVVTLVILVVVFLVYVGVTTLHRYITIPGLKSPPPPVCLPICLTQTPFSNIGHMDCGFYGIFNDTKIEKILFNENITFNLQLLNCIQHMFIHPKIQIKIIDNFIKYIYKKCQVPKKLILVYVKNTIGCHKLSHFFMNNLNETNNLDIIFYQLKLKTIYFKQFNRLTFCICECIENVFQSIPGFLFVLDVVKDLVFYFILREQFKFINGDVKSSDAEVTFSVGIVTCITASCAITGIYCLLNIQAMFPEEFWNYKYKLMFYILLLLLSPSLPLLLQGQSTNLGTKQSYWLVSAGWDFSSFHVTFWKKK